ncbi:MAG: hypothetical protein ACRC57_02050 [Sarcina sp.]
MTSKDNYSSANIATNPKQINHNETTFLTPMGTCENLVAVMPVILSDFETKIYCNFTYRYPISSIKTLKNTVYLQNIKFSNNNSTICLNGYIKKDIIINVKHQNYKKTYINIPFKTFINVNYYVNPLNDTEFKNISKKSYAQKKFFSMAEKPYWTHNYTMFSERIEERFSSNHNCKEYINKITLSLGISILQNRRVFLLEPNGTAKIIAQSDSPYKTPDNLISDNFEIGYDSVNGLIARVIKD